MTGWVAALFKRCPQGSRAEGAGTFLVIGHRGSPCNEAENTIPSFEMAVERDGANAVELDLCMTADGEIVVWHDWNPVDPACRLRRAGLEPDVRYCPCYPDDERPVSSWRYREFIAEHGYAEKDSGCRYTSAHIPTLNEFMAWAVSKTRLRAVFLDIKIPDEEVKLAPAMMERMEEIISRYSHRFAIVYETAHPRVLEACKRCRPDRCYTLDVEAIPGIIIRPSKFSAMRPAILRGNSIATLQRPRPTTLAPWTTHKRIAQHDLYLRDRHGRKGGEYISLVCFIVNDEEEMRCLVRMGVDGIQTDRPALLRKIVSGPGDASPSSADGGSARDLNRMPVRSSTL